jgi:hypothetical protein
VQLFRDRHRVVGANLLNDEFEQFAELAGDKGMKPGVYAALLLRQEIERSRANNQDQMEAA